MKNITRWNRPKSSILEYCDGNAATFYDQMKQDFMQRFSIDKKGEDTTLYADPALALLHTFSRSAFALTSRLDRMANELTIDSAKEKASLLKMAYSIGYQVTPPSSAQTVVALSVKEGKRGLLPKGTTFKSAPGVKPSLVFETKEDIRLDSAHNQLHVKGYRSNSALLESNTLHLIAAPKDVFAGKPLVLECEGESFATIAQAVTKTEKGIQVRFFPQLYKGHRFTIGKTKIYSNPQVDSVPQGPLQGEVPLNNSIKLREVPDLKRGDVVVLKDKSRILYAKVDKLDGAILSIKPHNRGGVDLGCFDLSTTVVGKALEVDVCGMKGRRVEMPNTTSKRYIQVLKLAGDWRALKDRKICTKKGLYRNGVCEGVPLSAAKLKLDQSLNTLISLQNSYNDSLGEDDEVSDITSQDMKTEELLKKLFTLFRHWYEEGYTYLVLENQQLLNNAQKIFVEPPVYNWSADPYLEGNAETLIIAANKMVTKGCRSVVVCGDSLRLNSISEITPLEKDSLVLTLNPHTSITANVDFYQTKSTFYSVFTNCLKHVNYDKNVESISVSGEISIEIEEDISVKDLGTALLMTYREKKWLLNKDLFKADDNKITLSQKDIPTLPEEMRKADIRFHGNIVPLYHGEKAPVEVKSSGEFPAASPSFLLKYSDISFVSKGEFTRGVGADISVVIDDVEWKQVESFHRSQPISKHYVVSFTENENVQVLFGDGTKGALLPPGEKNIYISYRRGTGLVGNCNAGIITRISEKKDLVESLQQPFPATGGNDLAGIESLRRNVSSHLNAMNRAVSVEDFAAIAKNDPRVLDATSMMNYERENKVVLTILLAGVSGKNDSGDSISIIEKIRSKVQSCCSPSIEVSCELAEIKKISCSITITLYPGYDFSHTETEIIEKIVARYALSNRYLGESISIGTIYKLTETVEGVDTVFIEMSSTDSTEINSAEVKADSNEVLYIPESCITVKKEGE